MVKEALKEMGLSDAEIEVYLSVLRQGRSTASQISSGTGMYRPYVYDNINKLLDKGLVSEIIVDGKKYFKATEPLVLRERMQERTEQLEKTIEELDKMREKDTDQVYVEVLRGKSAIRMAFRHILDILKKNRKLLHLGIGVKEELFLEKEPTFSRWFIRQLEKYNIKEKMISYESEKIFAGGSTTSYRFIPDEYFNPTNVLIDGDIVTIIFWSNPKYVIKIKSVELADAYKKQFELMWKHGKKRKWRQTITEKLK